MARDTHRLVLVDRGVEHRHRWDATCACGWQGTHRRRKQDAEKLYREHVAGLQRRDHARSSGREVRPRACTPADELPEELR